MKTLNVLLAILVSLLLMLLVFEGGLRLIGFGPVKKLNEPHATLGWSKRPDTTTRRKTKEFDVTFEVNSLGLRDDPMTSPAKPEGTFRVVCLGDSFTLGYAVEREDLFVDQLEGWWQSEGRSVDVINAGTEGYSTDQEVVWLLENGEAYDPDLVLLFTYDNDIYWNREPEYNGTQKPRFDMEGELDHAGPFAPPPPGGLEKSYALANFFNRLFVKKAGSRRFTPPGSSKAILEEHAALLVQPPGFMGDAVHRTGGALKALKAKCDELGARLVIAPIPSHSAIDPDQAERFGKIVLDLPRDAWSPDRPVEVALSLAEMQQIDRLDARPALKSAAAAGEELYFKVDWHFNPTGNRVFASFLHQGLNDLGVFPPEHLAQTEGAIPTAPPAAGGVPTWLKVYGLLWAILTGLFFLTYRDEPAWRPPVLVALMLGLIFGIVIGGNALLAMAPPLVSRFVLGLFVTGILMFVAYKLGRRLGTICELFKSFTLRGHWYLMPLVVVLLSVGSLLVVAASSPLVAPFIYTLF